MKTLLLFFIIIFSGITVTAQEVVASSGASGSITGYKVDWTLGEPVIETLPGSVNILTQGMHQTKLTVTGLEELTIPGLEIRVYPNPTSDLLIIEVIQTGNYSFRYELFDITGRKMAVNKMNSNIEEINMSNFVSGFYLLNVLNSDSEHVKVCKIIKK
ncbi:MAG: T9SS type A sorting domain-containing protein [Prolixibacteraceae bacterium]|nr:T9SS type A sorting domain-containing protein [Prolixibacteraceae bacterium]